MSNGLDPDQERHSVGLDLGPNCLQRLSRAAKVATGLKNEFDFFEGSWHLEYFGSLAKLDSMNLPKVEFIAYIYILL